MKIYVTWTQKNKINDNSNCAGIAVSEDGEVLTGHMSSSIEWLKHDLGVQEYGGMRPFKHDIYNKKFGEGNWTIEWVEELPKEVQKKMESVGT